jgi:hypothetical protein
VHRSQSHEQPGRSPQSHLLINDGLLHPSRLVLFFNATLLELLALLLEGLSTQQPSGNETTILIHSSL